MTSKHTPGPWLVAADGNVYAQEFYKPAPFTSVEGKEHPDFTAGLVALPYFCGDAKAEANAEFIVRAVNAHRDLLAALKTVHPDHPPVTNPCTACGAIAKAEGRDCDDKRREA